MSGKLKKVVMFIRPRENTVEWPSFEWSNCTILSTDSKVRIISYSVINPLSSNSDQHQFSPNDTHTVSRDKVMRINKMITTEKMP